ncbi:hypothetical protein GCM10027615_14950 [Plantactinospora veratri]
MVTLAIGTGSLPPEVPSEPTGSTESAACPVLGHGTTGALPGMVVDSGRVRVTVAAGRVAQRRDREERAAGQEHDQQPADQ